jgi:lipopolysaccharide export LptBFGC system permease protein LptF
MKFFELFDKIDSYFEGKKDSEKYIIIALPALVFIFISYLYIYPYSQSRLNKAKSSSEAIKQDISQYQGVINTIEGSNSLASLTEQMQKLDVKKEQANIEIDAIKAKAIEFESKQKEWNESLKFITNLAKNEQIEIENIKTNMHSDDNFRYFSANLKGVGEFKNILKYINEVEVNEPLLRVQNGKILFDDGMVLDLNLSTKRLNF